MIDRRLLIGLLPAALVAPYGRAEFGPMIEVSCAEGTMTNFFNQDIEPIPQASKPDF